MRRLKHYPRGCGECMHMKIAKVSRSIQAATIFFLIFFLTACSSEIPYAPVTSISQPDIPHSGIYTVRPGDTLYSIAWAYAMDYRDLAAFNRLSAPYQIHPGERIRLSGSRKMAYEARKKTPRVAASHYKVKKKTAHRTFSHRKRPSVHRKLTLKKPNRHRPVPRKSSPPIVVYHPSRPVRHWAWPAKGHLIARFSDDYLGNKGIDLAGRYGEPVRATANGIVVYSGTGVRGYGNLIILKHSDSYLSAYAFNKQILVKQGARVKAGQAIATMGRNNAGRVLLHFEIRRDGRPVDPLRYLS